MNMKYLIINADDFGYSFSVNKGIIEAHTKGVVTSTSVLVDAIAAKEAAKLKQYPELSVGLHFYVTDFANVRDELDRQIDKFVSIVGAMPDHIDTHKIHLTRHEGYGTVLPEYSKKHAIPLRQLSGVKFIESFFGMPNPGAVSLEQLKRSIDEATEEYNEIMCHVGYSDDYLREHSSYNDLREQELRAITDPTIRQYIEDKGLTLCGWGRVPKVKN